MWAKRGADGLGGHLELSTSRFEGLFERHGGNRPRRSHKGRRRGRPDFAGREGNGGEMMAVARGEQRSNFELGTVSCGPGAAILTSTSAGGRGGEPRWRASRMRESRGRRRAAVLGRKPPRARGGRTRWWQHAREPPTISPIIGDIAGPASRAGNPPTAAHGRRRTMSDNRAYDSAARRRGERRRRRLFARRGGNEIQANHGFFSSSAENESRS